MSTTMPTNALMTLAALAATASAERPSGEGADVHAARIFTGITQQLRDATLATAGAWSLVWLALSPGNANLAYIAQNQAQNQIAVCIRGTVPLLSDLSEDLDVGTVVAFQVGSTPVAVAAGAMRAFAEVMNAKSPPTQGGSYVNQNLVGALSTLLQGQTSAQTIYVTGHSLGGAIATMVALYLASLTSWPASSTPSFGVCTFAAPTVGLQSFTDAFQDQFGASAVQVVNAYDVVPQAWVADSLNAVTGWYPGPGPAATLDVVALIDTIKKLPRGNLYVQPGSPTITSTYNSEYAYLDQDLTRKTTQDFEGQVAFQHANSTYLSLLGATTPTAGPVVTSISPTSGSPLGGTLVTIAGNGFTSDSVVDFGILPGVDVTVVSSTEITVTTPPGWGTIDVTVTNVLGTSPAVPIAAFSFGGPEPVVVTAISPSSGPLKGGTSVTITGSGFNNATAVTFGKSPATAFSVVSDTEITATSPGVVLGQTVDVTVTVGVATSQTTAADEFTYKIEFRAV